MVDKLPARRTGTIEGMRFRYHILFAMAHFVAATVFTIRQGAGAGFLICVAVLYLGLVPLVAWLLPSESEAQ